MPLISMLAVLHAAWYSGMCRNARFFGLNLAPPVLLHQPRQRFYTGREAFYTHDPNDPHDPHDPSRPTPAPEPLHRPSTWHAGRACHPPSGLIPYRPLSLGFAASANSGDKRRRGVTADSRQGRR